MGCGGIDNMTLRESQLSAEVRSSESEPAADADAGPPPGRRSFLLLRPREACFFEASGLEHVTE